MGEEIVSDVFLIALQRIAEKPLPWQRITARIVAASQIQAANRLRALAGELAAWIADEVKSGDLADDVSERATLRPGCHA